MVCAQWRRVLGFAWQRELQTTVRLCWMSQSCANRGCAAVFLGILMVMENCHQILSSWIAMLVTPFQVRYCFVTSFHLWKQLADQVKHPGVTAVCVSTTEAGMTNSWNWPGYGLDSCRFGVGFPVKSRYLSPLPSFQTGFEAQPAFSVPRANSSHVKWPKCETDHWSPFLPRLRMCGAVLPCFFMARCLN